MAKEDRLDDCKVLIVDDDPDILSSFEFALKAEGAITDTATDGTEAITKVQKGDYDAVVLDMMLPKASGFLVLEKIGEMDEPPVVVMVTANLGKRHSTYAKSLGVHEYLTKPVPLQRLVDTVADLIEEQDEQLAS